MRISQIFYKQHIGWHLKKFWAQQGARKVADTGVEKILAEKGIPVCKPEDILNERREFTKVEIIGYKPKPVAFDETHPNWHSRPLLTYKDHNVLLEGLNQAKLLTKTVDTNLELPENLLAKKTKETDNRVKEIILTAHVFDAEQKKLPKIRDPERPAWNFPRTYGITQERRMTLLLANLLQFIENSSDLNVVKQKYLLNDAQFSYNFEKYGALIQFQLKADHMLTSAIPLSPVTSESTDNYELPDIFPIEPTITLTEENIYELKHTYPINLKLPKSYPHTIFVHHNDSEVKNLFEEEVTEEQIFGRSLLKTFTAAASYARQIYGDNTKELPKPVVVQCVYTNGRLFHFGVLQLNTLDLEKEGGIKNIWYQTERIPLFETCCYKVGKPVLEGYNNQVMKYLNTFYNNV